MLEDEVVEILEGELAEFSDREMEKCVRVWRDFVDWGEVGGSRKPETWAAAVYYLFVGQSRVSRDRVTQEEAAERFGVSKSSVQRKQGEILEVVSVGFLNGRYSVGESSEDRAEPGRSPFVDPLQVEGWDGAGSSGVGERFTGGVEGGLYDQFDAVRSDLFEFVIEEFSGEVPVAVEEFEGIRRPRETDAAFADWFTLDRESWRGETPLKTYLRERADDVPSEVLDWVSLWGGTEDRLYMVSEVNPGEGELILVDQLAGKSHKAVDYSASAELEPGLMIVTRLFPWHDSLHLSGDLEVFSIGLVPISARGVMEETGVDPWEVELTPLIIIPANLERVKLMKEGLSETVGFMAALEKIAPAALNLEAGDPTQFLSVLDRYSQAVRMSLNRFDLDIDFAERLNEFDKPLTRDVVECWSEMGRRLSEYLERKEFITLGGLSLLLAKTRALEEGREVRRKDFRWVENRILKNMNLLEDVVKSL